MACRPYYRCRLRGTAEKGNPFNSQELSPVTSMTTTTAANKSVKAFYRLSGKLFKNIEQEKMLYK